jgi:hypothetical protein
MSKGKDKLPTLPKTPIDFLLPSEVRQSENAGKGADLESASRALARDPANRGITVAQHASHASHGSHGSHASHGSHGSHASHGSHGSHASHGSHGSHASHGSHGSW